MVDGFPVDRIIYLLILLVMVATFVFRSYSAQWSVAFKHGVIWLIIFSVIVVFASFKDEMSGFRQEVMGGLFPSQAIINDEGQIILHKADNGHFYLDALADGVEIRFMVDTGASRVVLSQSDAHKIGIDTKNLDYNTLVSTANGEAWSASYRIDNIIIGDIEFRYIPASVNSGEMSGSLLGMSFLEQLSSFTIERERLIMTP